MPEPTVPTRLDDRAALAVTLARINQQLACISLDAPLLDFATPEEQVMFHAGLERARREVTAAELRVHDLIFGVRVAA